jgi:hypothetical protein
MFNLKNKVNMKNIMIENTSLEELVSEIKKIVKQVIETCELSAQNDSEKVLTRKETSELLQVSFVTLNKWNKLGVLPSYSVGTRVYYKWNDVQNAMKRVA